MNPMDAGWARWLSPVSPHLCLTADPQQISTRWTHLLCPFSLSFPHFFYFLTILPRWWAKIIIIISNILEKEWVIQFQNKLKQINGSSNGLKLASQGYCLLSKHQTATIGTAWKTLQQMLLHLYCSPSISTQTTVSLPVSLDQQQPLVLKTKFITFLHELLY